MKNRNLIRAVAILVIVAAAIPFAVAGKARRDATVPVVFSMGSASLAPGSYISIEIDLNRSTPIDQGIAVSTHTPGNWAQLPRTVVVPAGSASVIFTAKVSDNATGMIDGCGACNGGTASGSAMAIAY